jgi:hypothetical protein
MERPSLERRASLVAHGFSDYELRRGVRSGELFRIRRGSYLTSPVPANASERHCLAIRAAAPDLAESSVASHASAAVLHGLPLWGLPLNRVHVTKSRTYGGRRTPRLHVHVARLDPDEVVLADGVRVTTAARTVVDLARCLPFEAAVVLGDAALASGITTPEELTDMVRRSARRPGAGRARRAVSFLDGRSESVGESRSRVHLARVGLPPPLPQWEVRDADGVTVGRGDFGWPERKVIGEFDGRAKYGRLLKPGERPADAVYREKLREDALRSLGCTVIRWTWHDLEDLEAFAAVARRLRTALAISD